MGGGEVFQDTASSVFALKDVKGDAKYLMLHGAGTVGAAGGWVSYIFHFFIQSMNEDLT